MMKGGKSLIILNRWRLWKQQIDCLFNAAIPGCTELVGSILREAKVDVRHHERTQAIATSCTTS